MLLKHSRPVVCPLIKRYRVRFLALPWEFSLMKNYSTMCKDWVFLCFIVLCPCPALRCLRGRSWPQVRGTLCIIYWVHRNGFTPYTTKSDINGILKIIPLNIRIGCFYVYCALSLFSPVLSLEEIPAFCWPQVRGSSPVLSLFVYMVHKFVSPCTAISGIKEKMKKRGENIVLLKNPEFKLCKKVFIFCIFYNGSHCILHKYIKSRNRFLLYII